MNYLTSTRSQTLRLQVVLYGNEPSQLENAHRAAINSLRQAPLDRWSIVFGDCSPLPLVSGSLETHFRSLAAAEGGAFEYVYFGENLGHGGGHNLLHESCKEDLTLILNPDGVLAPDAVTKLLEAMVPGVGVVDARQVPMEHPKEYDPLTGETSWSSLACAITPSKLFRQLGGIDHHTFPMYCDDVDYSWRVRLAGYSTRYCPSARMFHDKRIDQFGNLAASETERYSSPEAALLLAYKYSRDDVVASLIRSMVNSGDPYRSRALSEFRRREASNELPERIDMKHEVASFVNGAYGDHRF